MLRRLILFWVVTAAATGAGFGQLAFESKIVSRLADPADEQIEATFPFVNEKLETVKITKVDSSCGCLKAESDKLVYEPGEKGTITGVFSLGVRTGTYEKAITVTTQSVEAGELTQELRARVTVPEVMEITPKQLIWNLGEELKSKDFILEVKRDKPIRVTAVTASREGFECEIHEIEPGKKYRLELKPGSTETPVMGIVRVETDCEITKHQRQLAFFSVKRPDPTPTPSVLKQ